MTLLALSFQTVHFHTTAASWERQGQLKRQLKRQLNNTPDKASGERQRQLNKASGAIASPSMQRGAKPYARPYKGGTFVAFDWEQNKVQWQIVVDSTTGFCWRDDLLYLNLLRAGEIVAVDGYGHEQRRISHRLFNDLHSIIPSRRGFLLTSTGVDSIVEIDPQGNVLYEWCALDHGYDRCPDGQQRLLDRTLDHRYSIYETTEHTTHVNSARFADESEETILATLFHQGKVVAIDRASGEAHTLLDGLVSPHDLRPYSGGWLLSNSRQNETLLLSADWEIRERINLDSRWVQSTIPLADGSLVIADVGNHRLIRVFVQEQRPYEVRTFPPEWHIYGVEEVTANHLKFFH